MELDEKYTSHLEKSLSKINISPELFKVSWEEGLLHLVPSWTQKDTKLQNLD